MRGRRGVREHKFFAGHVNVDELERRGLRPPWIPTIESATDLRNFDDYGGEVEDPSEWERFIKIYPEAFAAW